MYGREGQYGRGTDLYSCSRSFLYSLTLPMCFPTDTVPHAPCRNPPHVESLENPELSGAGIRFGGTGLVGQALESVAIKEAEIVYEVLTSSQHFEDCLSSIIIR
ncbi:hypothetical protein ACQRBN_09350 [Bariatricus sp. SGI.154]|uniref:hypothetical protein n=1 Tax=Bariatricus sp. SGI.154 TaxID=3420549 RepID=UPI003CFC20AA